MESSTVSFFVKPGNPTHRQTLEIHGQRDTQTDTRDTRTHRRTHRRTLETRGQTLLNTILALCVSYDNIVHNNNNDNGNLHSLQKYQIQAQLQCTVTGETSVVN